MPVEALLLALGSALLHATWNSFVKARGGGDPIANAYMIGLGTGLAALPCLLIVGLPAREAWPFMITAAVVSTLYFPLIGYSYRVGDMSATYPLIRGGSPLFTALLGAAVLGEFLSPGSWAGVLLLSLGIIGMGFESILRGGLTKAGLATALCASAIIVSNNLVDGQGVRLSGNPAAYVMMGNVITTTLLLPIALRVRGRAITRDLFGNLPFALFAGLMVNGSYILVATAMTMAPIGVVSAMRETSVLFGTIIAAVVLKEKFGRWRWVAALAIVGGLILIRLG